MGRSPAECVGLLRQVPGVADGNPSLTACSAEYPCGGPVRPASSRKRADTLAGVLLGGLIGTALAAPGRNAPIESLHRELNGTLDLLEHVFTAHELRD
jgi:hypothetical protein